MYREIKGLILKPIRGIYVYECAVLIILNTDVPVFIFGIFNAIILNVWNILSKAKFKPVHFSHPSLTRSPDWFAFVIVIMNINVIRKRFIGFIVDGIFGNVIA